MILYNFALHEVIFPIGASDCPGCAVPRDARGIANKPIRASCRFLFEEARELKASIRKKDYQNMEEELGDVLLQVISTRSWPKKRAILPSTM